ncbi:acetate kinase [Streptococcus chenjunshii]|uniref:Acetate kinase n=1 Tax=Streptococcus chenjunshii TaxID=2173853 RepID=A0A372KMX4_9STRE|nr:acetate kinase [Streptococcus chenjunshii]AXQ79002.1 acetate kinase [Streptococcus chenjunshii]RFU51429.1 acetate kinase [Streptococcus chenjunshii]RFU53629.1 acetate kinase [Streptococcus chenjunshii]
MKINLNQMVDYHDAQITSRSLSKKLGLTAPIMIYAMDKEETISGEQSPQTKLIQVLAGCLEVTMGDDEAPQKLTAQDLLVIQPQQLHAFKAAQKCKFLQIEL